MVFTSKVFNPKGHTSPEGFLFHYILPAVDPSLVPKKAVPLTPEILEKYVGKYWSKEHHQKLPVIRKGDKLYIKESFWSKVELKPRSTTQFFGESKQVGKVFINFVMDPYGQVKQFIAYLGFRGFRFDKIE